MAFRFFNWTIFSNRIYNWSQRLSRPAFSGTLSIAKILQNSSKSIEQNQLYCVSKQSSSFKESEYVVQSISGKAKDAISQVETTLSQRARQGKIGPS